MSCELETLDQLLGGEVSLAIIRKVYPDEDAFRRGVHGLLHSGEFIYLRAKAQKYQRGDGGNSSWKEL